MKVISKKVFTQAPLILPAAVILGIYPPEKFRGSLNGRSGKCKRIFFELDQPELVRKVDLSISGTRMPPEFYIPGSILYVEIPFRQKGTCPVDIYVNNTPALSFKATAVKN